MFPQSVLFYPTNNPRDPSPKETMEVKTRTGYGVSSEQLVVSEYDSSEDENYEMSENAEASDDEEDEDEADRLSNSSGESSSFLSSMDSPTVNAPDKFEALRQPVVPERSTLPMSINQLNTSFEANSSTLRNINFYIESHTAEQRDNRTDSRPRMPSIPSLVNRTVTCTDHTPPAPKTSSTKQKTQDEDTDMEIKIIEKPAIFKSRPAGGATGNPLQPIVVDEDDIEDEEHDEVEGQNEDENLSIGSFQLYDIDDEDDADSEAGSVAPSEMSEDAEGDEVMDEEAAPPAPPHLFTEPDFPSTTDIDFIRACAALNPPAMASSTQPVAALPPWSAEQRLKEKCMSIPFHQRLQAAHSLCYLVNMISKGNQVENAPVRPSASASISRSTTGGVHTHWENFGVYKLQDGMKTRWLDDKTDYMRARAENLAMVGEKVANDDSEMYDSQLPRQWHDIAQHANERLTNAYRNTNEALYHGTPSFPVPGASMGDHRIRTFKEGSTPTKKDVAPPREITQPEEQVDSVMTNSPDDSDEPTEESRRSGGKLSIEAMMNHGSPKAPELDEELEAIFVAPVIDVADIPAAAPEVTAKRDELSTAKPASPIENILNPITRKRKHETITVEVPIAPASLKDDYPILDSSSEADADAPEVVEPADAADEATEQLEVLSVTERPIKRARLKRRTGTAIGKYVAATAVGAVLGGVGMFAALVASAQ